RSQPARRPFRTSGRSHSCGLPGVRVGPAYAPLTGMRKLIVLPALLSFLACLGSAPVVWATPSIPTCLISNGGSGGHFTKTLICVELLDQPRGHAGSGRYSPGDADTV